jgi:hypothetical protein
MWWRSVCRSDATVCWRGSVSIPRNPQSRAGTQSTMASARSLAQDACPLGECRVGRDEDRLRLRVALAQRSGRARSPTFHASVVAEFVGPTHFRPDARDALAQCAPSRGLPVTRETAEPSPTEARRGGAVEVVRARCDRGRRRERGRSPRSARRAAVTSRPSAQQKLARAWCPRCGQGNPVAARVRDGRSPMHAGSDHASSAGFPRQS